MRYLAALFGFALLVLLQSAIAADEPQLSPAPRDAENERFFEQKVRPLLAEHCYACHGEKKQEGGLRLDSREAVLKGSEAGAVVVAGKPDESRLIEAVRYRNENLQMPPDGKLPAGEIAALETWVKLGLPWPAQGASPPMKAAGVDFEKARQLHWAFRPVAKPAVPAVEHESAATTPIDRFIIARLEAQGLSLSPRADRRTLIRRATFDLIGLPPSPEEVEAFIADDAPDSFARLVDRLLASPQYGERWGRYWLDVARYADNKGYVFFEDKELPWAYTYRDYVIRAFNEDLPFDRFVLEQLAADQLELGDDKSALAAMGFLTLGARFMNNVHDILDDRIDVLTRGLLGLTVGCARCHDHKYDPIPTDDYYSLYGVFRSSVEPTLMPLFQPVPDTDQYRKFDEELQKRVQAFNEFIEQKHTELVTSARTRAAEYLMAAHEQMNQPSDEEFMLLTDKGALNPAMITRWKLYLEKSLRSKHPVWTAWGRFAAIPDEKFSEQAAAVAADLADLNVTPKNRNADSRLPSPSGRGAGGEGATDTSPLTPTPLPGGEGLLKPAGRAQSPAEGFTDPIHPLVLAEFAGKPPASMKAVAERYSALLNRIGDKWQTLLADEAAANRPAPAALPDPAEEELRQVFYGREAPPDVPVLIGWGFLTLLPDRPSQEEYKKLVKAVDEWSAKGDGAPPRAMILVDSLSPHDPRVFLRGNPHRLGNPVPRRFLGIVDPPERQPFAHGSGRLELAKAIVDPANPLTARVIVNRVWQQHFGNGLVRTPSDFGLRGDPPTHPLLLDWMAATFVEQGWSLKSLHRQIMLSQVYQQQSDDRPDCRSIDPENRLLWKMNRRRLAFEATRDSLVAVTGTLDLSVGGPAVNILAGGFVPRRTIYGYVDRMDLPELFRSFDFPTPLTSSPGRDTTTIPPQALYLMNNPFALEASRRVAGRADVASLQEVGPKVRRVYALLFGRQPDDDELHAAVEFLGMNPPEARWSQLTHALLMTNEFVTVD